MAPKAYAEVKNGIITNLVMMDPAVAARSTESDLYDAIYVDISETTGDAVIGYEYADGAFSVPADLIEKKWDPIRKERDRLLTETDWIVIKAKETGSNIPAAWKTYRQALRDITTTFDNPDEVVFPDKP